MKIASYQKFTLVDYPGKIATTIFTIGCNFRCPFCHNPELVISPQIAIADNKIEKEFFEFLKKRVGKLEAVCITGGEPSLQPDIVEFMKKIKDLNYLVKLDTNGTRPVVIEKALKMKVVDFIAMDIKNSLQHYHKTVNTQVNLNKIKLSVDLIKNSGINYEFRTTVVPGIHTYKDFDEIAKWLRGANHYSLQEYRDKKILDENLRQKTADKVLDLNKIKKTISKNFKKMEIRRYSE